MADESKPETGAKPEEIADQDLTEVVGGVRTGSMNSGFAGDASCNPMKDSELANSLLEQAKAAEKERLASSS